VKATIETKLATFEGWGRTADLRLKELGQHKAFMTECASIAAEAQAGIDEVTSHWQMWKDLSITARASGIEALDSLGKFKAAADKYSKVCTH
jgi:hypothetical protein